MHLTPQDMRLAADTNVPPEVWGIILQIRRSTFAKERVNPLLPLLERVLWAKRYMAYNPDEGKYAWGVDGLARIGMAMNRGNHTINLHTTMSGYVRGLAHRLNGNIYHIARDADILKGQMAWESYRHLMFLLPPPDVPGTYSFRFAELISGSNYI